MRLVWKQAAKADRREIRAYIALQNPLAALKLDALFGQKASLLAHCPHAGRLGRVPGTREWVLHPRYILVYSLAKHTVCILRLLHASRQWP